MSLRSSPERVYVIPVENFGEKRNMWKGSPVFPGEMFQVETLIPFSDFRGR